MKIPIKASKYAGEGTHNVSTFVDWIPDVCPICLHSCTPRHLDGWLQDEKVQKVFGCTRDECQALFIAYYEYSGDTKTQISERLYEYYSEAPISFDEKTFPEIIDKISQQFSSIYNEALEAETNGLLNICGAGYRKAIEFLIKDYLISVKKKPEDEIKKTFLGTCIEKYIEDKNIKKCAKRAVWIGNDETHYIRIWEEKDLKDLKDLIDVTLFWIESEYKTERYEIDMPDNSKS